MTWPDEETWERDCPPYIISSIISIDGVSFRFVSAITPHGEGVTQAAGCRASKEAGPLKLATRTFTHAPTFFSIVLSSYFIPLPFSSYLVDNPENCFGMSAEFS